MEGEFRCRQFTDFTGVQVQRPTDEVPIADVVSDATLRFTGTRHPLEHAAGLSVPGPGASEPLPGGFGPGKMDEADSDFIAGLRHAQVKYTALPENAPA